MVTHYGLDDCRELSGSDYSLLRAFSAEMLARHLALESIDYSDQDIDDGCDTILALAWFKIAYRSNRLYWETPIKVWLRTIVDVTPRYRTAICSSGTSLKNADSQGYDIGKESEQWVDVMETISLALSQLETMPLEQRLLWLLVRHLVREDSSQLSREEIAQEMGVSVRMVYKLLGSVRFLFQVFSE